jgi:hypothetical protein
LILDNLRARDVLTWHSVFLVKGCDLSAPDMLLGGQQGASADRASVNRDSTAYLLEDVPFAGVGVSALVRERRVDGVLADRHSFNSL